MNEKLFALLDTVQKTAVQAGDAASNVAYAAGKKADSLLSAAKVNVKIMEKQRQVEEALKGVGSILYATHTGSPSDSDLLLEKLQAIDALKAEIAELEIQSGKAEKVRTCHACGAEAQKDDQFCRECGEKL